MIVIISPAYESVCLTTILLLLLLEHHTWCIQRKFPVYTIVVSNLAAHNKYLGNYLFKVSPTISDQSSRESFPDIIAPTLNK